MVMDEADEDAEGDIDPDFVPPVPSFNSSTIACANNSSSLTVDESQLMPTVAHGSNSYHPSSSTGISSLPSDGCIGFGSGGSDYRNAIREGIYSSGGFSAHDIGVHGHGVSNVEMPVSVPVPSRSFLDSTASFPELGIQGVGMNLNVGVSVGFGMGINRFGMDMMSMGIAFPTFEPEAWLLPGASAPSPQLSSPGTSAEENEHTLGGMGSFGSNSMYIDPLTDHARERFGSPGSPESAYPLGYAMG
jgi:hypothetical protein